MLIKKKPQIFEAFLYLYYFRLPMAALIVAFWVLSYIRMWVKKLIKIQGRDDSLGKALLYKTTDDYLKHFGISNLNEMPTPEEVSELVESENLT